MGDMEIIDQYGVRATFTDKGVEISLVDKSECCMACNDPRLLRDGNTRICQGCGCRT